MARILIIDDDPTNITALGNILSPCYDIIVATDGRRSLEIARNGGPDLILLDIMIPGMDGYEVCRYLKGLEETAHIPVIFITAMNGTDDIVKGFEVGGVDFITKPFNAKELMARVNTHIELTLARTELALYAESMEELGRMLLGKTQELDETVAKLNVSVRADPLTGLANRIHMTERMKDEASRYRRGGKIFSFIMADIDKFKAINDAHGHECGDHALVTLSGIIRGAIREQDFVARWGGEEFLFLLPETDSEGALVLAEKIRREVESRPIQYRDLHLQVTLTLGIAAFDPVLGLDGSIAKADEAMYSGKTRGRNRVAHL